MEVGNSRAVNSLGRQTSMTTRVKRLRSVGAFAVSMHLLHRMKMKTVRDAASTPS